uniref:Uncharacterized protein n=1 Tax=Amphimedon queenslandica TaxID=400682 RepID=A0A1X7VKR6_AMPQE
MCSTTRVVTQPYSYILDNSWMTVRYLNTNNN